LLHDLAANLSFLVSNMTLIPLHFSGFNFLPPISRFQFLNGIKGIFTFQTVSFILKIFPALFLAAFSFFKPFQQKELKSFKILFFPFSLKKVS